MGIHDSSYVGEVHDSKVDEVVGDQQCTEAKPTHEHAVTMG